MLGRDSYAKTRIWTRGSQTIVAFVHAARRRRRAVLIGGASLLVLAVLIGFGAVRLARHSAFTSVVASNGALWRCLLGEPLVQGERPSTRIRAIQLGAQTMAEVERAPEKGPHWPDRCVRSRPC